MNRSAGLWLPFILVGGLIGVILMVALQINLKIYPGDSKDINMSYADMAAIVLTAVSVMVAILAAFIAALAIWGYSQFGKLTKNASEKHLEKLISNGPFSKKIEDIVLKYVSHELESGKLRDMLAERIDQIALIDADKRSGAQPESGAEKPFVD